MPESIRMRHDEHYVATLSAPAGTPIGRLLPIDQIDPNPEQPRQAMGDLSELMASIAEKGVHRADRGPGAGAGGIRSSPASAGIRPPSRSGSTSFRSSCGTSTTTEVIELALVENLQRKDLTAFEEADALHALASRSGLTHEDLAKRLGKSRTAITETPGAAQDAAGGEESVSAGRHFL